MVAVRHCACALALCAVACAQGGTQPKAAAADYPVHAKAGELAMGAEYLVHSFSSAGQTFFADDYLVVEVAAYAPKGRTVELSAGQFMLRINGKKQVIFPDSAEFVGASLKYSDWENPRSLEADIGVGGTDVILGRQTSSPRFPGDRRESQRRAPPLPRAPNQIPGGVEKQQSQTPAEAAVESALPQAAFEGAVSGHLYFRYKGKTKSIKKLEVIYQKGEQKTVLPLL